MKFSIVLVAVAMLAASSCQKSGSSARTNETHIYRVPQWTYANIHSSKLDDGIQTSIIYTERGKSDDIKLYDTNCVFIYKGLTYTVIPIDTVTHAPTFAMQYNGNQIMITGKTGVMYGTYKFDFYDSSIILTINGQSSQHGFASPIYFGKTQVIPEF